MRNHKTTDKFYRINESNNLLTHDMKYNTNNKDAAYRIYGHQMRQYNNNNDDDDDEPRRFLISDSGRSIKNSVLAGFDGSNILDMNKREIEKDLFLKKLEQGKEFKRFEKEMQLKKLEEEKEEELKIAQKIHQYELEEIKNEKKRLERLVKNLKTEKEKLLAGNDKNLATSVSATAVVAADAVAAPSDEKKSDQKDADAINCVVCMDAKREILCTPCFHVALCSNCSKNLQDCPVCMGKAEMKRIYLS